MLIHTPHISYSTSQRKLISTKSIEAEFKDSIGFPIPVDLPRIPRFFSYAGRIDSIGQKKRFRRPVTRRPRSKWRLVVHWEWVGGSVLQRNSCDLLDAKKPLLVIFLSYFIISYLSYSPSDTQLSCTHLTLSWIFRAYSTVGSSLVHDSFT